MKYSYIPAGKKKHSIFTLKPKHIHTHTHAHCEVGNLLITVVRKRAQSRGEFTSPSHRAGSDAAGIQPQEGSSSDPHLLPGPWGLPDYRTLGRVHDGENCGQELSVGQNPVLTPTPLCFQVLSLFCNQAEKRGERGGHLPRCPARCLKWALQGKERPGLSHLPISVV